MDANSGNIKMRYAIPFWKGITWRQFKILRFIYSERYDATVIKYELHIWADYMQYHHLKNPIFKCCEIKSGN